jgi:hypothetical protein
MGLNKEREVLKRASRSARWAAQVDLMSDEHVLSILKKIRNEKPRKKAS